MLNRLEAQGLRRVRQAGRLVRYEHFVSVADGDASVGRQRDGVDDAALAQSLFDAEVEKPPAVVRENTVFRAHEDKPGRILQHARSTQAQQTLVYVIELKLGTVSTRLPAPKKAQCDTDE